MGALPLDSRSLYLLLIALVAVQRLAELALSKRNLALALAAGGKEVESGHYPVMVALHTAFLIACPVEVYLFDRPFVPALGLVCGIVLAFATCLRYWAIGTLGARWNTRIVVVPGAAPVVGGPFRFLRHPNYLAVILEIAFLPLLHGAWVTAVVFSLANAALLRVRISAEEKALAEVSGYERAFAGRPRLIPSGSEASSR
ncbi:MAG TPA: isoprenylcysteine carboxylmethyltransferase family protein [Thermoanaerobaculia bacterium]|jgi:methyltransferase|nr:isoprenylcysteine carboxylmethyltransferase family protein [Thermoanaerobaculia bacterium]